MNFCFKSLLSKFIKKRNIIETKFIKRAIELAQKGMEANEGGPFGALVVNQAGKIIGEGNNKVTSTNDPTAHAEIVAIRNACAHIQDFQLTGCTVYTSCEPCPMCLAAIYWARPDKIIYACSRKDAASIGFDDEYIYQEIPLPIEERAITTKQLYRKEGLVVFNIWQQKENKIDY